MIIFQAPDEACRGDCRPGPPLPARLPPAVGPAAVPGGGHQRLLPPLPEQVQPAARRPVHLRRVHRRHAQEPPRLYADHARRVPSERNN